MGAEAALELTCRDRAILRAVGGGGAELTGGAEPDLFLDGRCCADQLAAHRLARAGLIAAVGSGAPGGRVAARLTAVGRDAMRAERAPSARLRTPTGVVAQVRRAAMTPTDVRSREYPIVGGPAR